MRLVNLILIAVACLFLSACAPGLMLINQDSNITGNVTSGGTWYVNATAVQYVYGASDGVGFNVTTGCLNSSGVIVGTNESCLNATIDARVGGIAGDGVGFNNTGSGLNATGSTVGVNYSQVQARVNYSCAGGSSIRVIAVDGSVTCESDSEGTDTDTWNTTIEMRNAVNNSGYYNISVNFSNVLNHPAYSDTNFYPTWVNITNGSLHNFTMNVLGYGILWGAFADLDTDTYNTTADIRAALSAGPGLSYSSGAFSHNDASALANGTATARTYATNFSIDSFGHLLGVSYAAESVVDTYNLTWQMANASATLNGNLSKENATIVHITNTTWAVSAVNNTGGLNMTCLYLTNGAAICGV
jgi:hypothetical protein